MPIDELSFYRKPLRARGDILGKPAMKSLFDALRIDNPLKALRSRFDIHNPYENDAAIGVRHRCEIFQKLRFIVTADLLFELQVLRLWSLLKHELANLCRIHGNRLSDVSSC
jgi:hypothetical protein